ncbi:MAG: hypothetical protein R3338_09485 [Thermoanaerobaculia bacterium]|nr:hypothetical protein [Thermoanaerobaculia bacterium]
MRKIQTLMDHTINDLRRGDESWRVKAAVVLYALGGAVINLVALALLGA